MVDFLAWYIRVLQLKFINLEKLYISKYANVKIEKCTYATVLKIIVKF